MPGFDELLVGYRARDPRATMYADKYGGNCIDCGNRVYFNPSAFPILGGDDHDPRVVCTWCYEHNREHIDASMV